MQCKRNNAGHVYRIDVPHFFHREDESVIDYYEREIALKLSQKDDPFWRNWTPEVFTHLQCQHCGAEEHIYLPCNYLKTIIYNPDIAFQWSKFTKMQYVQDGEVMFEKTVQVS